MSVCVCVCVWYLRALASIVWLTSITSMQVGLGEAGEFDITNDAWKKLVNSKFKTTTSPNSSELDHFMVLLYFKPINLRNHNDLNHRPNPNAFKNYTSFLTMLTVIWILLMFTKKFKYKCWILDRNHIAWR